MLYSGNRPLDVLNVWTIYKVKYRLWGLTAENWVRSLPWSELYWFGRDLTTVLAGGHKTVSEAITCQDNRAELLDLWNELSNEMKRRTAEKKRKEEEARQRERWRQEAQTGLSLCPETNDGAVSIVPLDGAELSVVG